MQKKLFILVLIIVILLNFISAEETFTINLNSLTKIHIQDIRTIELHNYREGIEYMHLPKNAFNLQIFDEEGNILNYSRFSYQNSYELLDIISCCIKDTESIMPTKELDTVVHDLEELKKIKNNLTLSVEYDIPNNDEPEIRILRNWIGVSNRDQGDFLLILPYGAKYWSLSENPQKISEINGSIILHWKNVEKDNLDITYGSNAEFLIYSYKKDNILANIITINITLLTIIIAFSIYIKQETKNKYNLSSLFYVFVVFVGFQIPFTFSLINNQGLVAPFRNEAIIGTLIRFIGIFVLIIIAYLFLEKKYLPLKTMISKIKSRFIG